MSSFAAIPIPGLPDLLDTAHKYNEVREVIKFLALVTVNVCTNHEPFGPGTYFLAQASLYRASTVRTALLRFGDQHFTDFEGAVQESVANFVYGQIYAHHDDATYIQVKMWLIECACATDSTNVLADKLAEFRAPQPIPANIPHGIQSALEPSLFPIPEMATAFRRIVDEGGANGAGFTEDDMVHIIREFMRVGMTCGEVWQKCVPEDWDFERDGMPQLSTLEQYTALKQIRQAWREMIKNPFSEAPLHIRRILADCNIQGTLWLFLVDTRQVFQFIAWPASMRTDRLQQHLVLCIQEAAEDWNYELFVAIRHTRLRNPFLGQDLPPPESSLDNLDVDRQPPGFVFQTRGLPEPYEIRTAAQIPRPPPPGSILNGPVAQADFASWLDFIIAGGYRDFWPPSPTRTEDVQVLSQDPDLAVYATEYILAERPTLVATGPRYNPRLFGVAVPTQELQSDDMCFVCTCPLLTDEDKDIVRLPCGHLVHVQELDELVNGAYFAQVHVCCGVCRRKLCKIRPTLQVLPDGRDNHVPDDEDNPPTAIDGDVSDDELW